MRKMQIMEASPQPKQRFIVLRDTRGPWELRVRLSPSLKRFAQAFREMSPWFPLGLVLLDFSSAGLFPITAEGLRISVGPAGFLAKNKTLGMRAGGPGHVQVLTWPTASPSCWTSPTACTL